MFSHVGRGRGSSGSTSLVVLLIVIPWHLYIQLFHSFFPKDLEQIGATFIQHSCSSISVGMSHENIKHSM